MGWETKVELTIASSWKRFVDDLQSEKRVPFAAHWSSFRSAYADDALPVVWTPSESVRSASNVHQFLTELGLEDFGALHRFSVHERETFWQRALERLGIVFETPPDAIVELANGVRQPRWLPGASLDITRSCFTAPPDKPAIVFGREDETIETLTYAELEERVDRFAGGLVGRGLGPDDGVALYMPMTPECVVAYLGTVRAGCRVISIADSFSAEELQRPYRHRRGAGDRHRLVISARRARDRALPQSPRCGRDVRPSSARHRRRCRRALRRRHRLGRAHRWRDSR